MSWGEFSAPVVVFVHARKFLYKLYVIKQQNTENLSRSLYLPHSLILSLV